MPYEFKLTHEIQFVDTDMAGIVHFGNYFRLMEETEHAFVKSLGLSIFTKVDGRTLSWPRVKTSCEYFAPLRFEDEVEVQLLVREKKRTSVTYDFLFRKADALVARGSITAVCVVVDKLGKMKAVTMPETFSRRIETAPADLLNPN